MRTNPSAYFTVNLSDQLGSLQRLLGTIRRRGFEVETMMVTKSAVTEGYHIEVRLGGERSFEMLARQIAKLFEVSSVSLHASRKPVEYSTSA